MYLLLKIGISIAMLVYQRVIINSRFQEFQRFPKNPRRESEWYQRISATFFLGGFGQTLLGAHLSNEKNLGWLGYIGDYTTLI